MTFLDRLAQIVGPSNLLTGPDCAPYSRDWMGEYAWAPLAVVRPANTAEVAAVVKLAAAEGVAVVPSAGRTGITGAAVAEGQLVLSVERMNRIRALKREARLAVVEAGVILTQLHEAAEAEGLYFPLWFGARGSAMIGGVLSTNAGGSNVLRYGSTRALCLGLEVVLADGRVMNLMSELHKDNTGYDLKQLFIGAEGTLGIITAAVMKLVPAPRAHATAVLAVPDLAAALSLLNRLQEATGGLVEAFEFMPRGYHERLRVARPDLGLPFPEIHDVTILVELGATAPRDAEPGPDGAVPLAALLEEVLGTMFEEGLVIDAVIAQTEAQRRAIWARREAAAEIMVGVAHTVDTDISVPLDRVAEFLDRALASLARLDPGATTITVAHLGDGNLHYSVVPASGGTDLKARLMEDVEGIVADLGGSFSAEHGIGISKKGSMARRKDPVALDVMRAVKAALDPQGILNPGKVIPDRS
ncbi:FAD-binding oxidoreductase [Frigidibacter sp. RF13]|uniref:FAD-binding oxidoreductase n=1 Tax=Frigidibacter sp. RF13 TaxID=2997340 RepID=UPI00226D6B92|nr:FAD-binding oxidoreductase [Frigidibacter sp. RF13]MCY1126352.1 FAD-binding oxidoreductase [Frigidibacter sp. RF13]